MPSQCAKSLPPTCCLAIVMALGGCARIGTTAGLFEAPAENKFESKESVQAAPRQQAATAASGDRSEPDADEITLLLNEVQRQRHLSEAWRSKLESDLRAAHPASRRLSLGYLRASIKETEARREKEALARAAAACLRSGERAKKNDEPAVPGTTQRLPPPPEEAFDQIAEIIRNHRAYPQTGQRGEPDSLAQGQPPNRLSVTGATHLPPAMAALANDENLLQRVSYEAPVHDDWRQDLQRAIRGLEAATHEPPRGAEDIERHAALRLLYVVADRREDALRPMKGAPAAQQEFWTKQIHGLATYLDSRRLPDATQRATEAVRYFREASAHLADAAALQVRHVTFCTAVRSFGVVRRFSRDDFLPGQEVLLYAEIENFTSELSDGGGHHVSLKASYQLIDNQGRNVLEDALPAIEETCGQKRRDFFLSYRISLPQRISPGKHTLRLSIEDSLSQKAGAASVEFTVKKK